MAKTFLNWGGGGGLFFVIKMGKYMYLLSQGQHIHAFTVIAHNSEEDQQNKVFFF